MGRTLALHVADPGLFPVSHLVPLMHQQKALSTAECASGTTINLKTNLYLDCVVNVCFILKAVELG